MKRAEHLLVILMEECAEVSQRASKALRFGLREIEPGQEYDNAVRLAMEIDDLNAAIGMLQHQGCVPNPSARSTAEKVAKVEQFLTYSRTCGTLENPNAE